MDLIFLIFGIIILIIIVTSQRGELRSMQNELLQMNRILKKISDEILNKVEHSELKRTKPSEEAIKIIEAVKPQPKPIDNIPIVEINDAIKIPSIDNTPIPDVAFSSQPNLKESVSQNTTVNDQEVTSKIDEPKLSWFQKFKKNNPDVEKFIGENLINKIGILILVLGISFFVKYAIDRDWINEPARVGIGILCGSILLFVAHKLRKNYKAFSSVLVSGAIAVFYFTIGIAFHDYHLFNQTTAFIIMFVITLFSTFVAIAYDRQELIILAQLGGFAVPFIVSTGSGNYHVLFTYIIILNIGMLFISYYKKWWLLNFISFVLTIGIFGVWYNTKMDFTSSVYRDALVYASIYYVIFSFAFMLHNIARKTKAVYLDIAAFIANTTFYYAIGINIFNNFLPQYQGLFTLILGIYNLIYAIIIFKKFNFDYTIIYVLVGTALTLATVTIPIQFSGNYVTLFWMAEGVLLFWLATKSKIQSFALAAVIVQILAVFSLIQDWQQYFRNTLEGNFVLNQMFITGILMILSLIASKRLFKTNSYNIKVLGIHIPDLLYTRILTYLAIILGYLVPLLDIDYFTQLNFVNYGTRIEFSVVYHMLYTTFIIYLGIKSKNNIQVNIAYIITVINIIAYLSFLYRIPLLEKIHSLSEPKIASNIAFWIHYIVSATFIMQLITIYKSLIENKPFNKFSLNIVPWILAFIFVFVASSEMNIAFTYRAISLEDFHITLTFVSKVILPILWGSLSFVFLIYGIRKNLKTTRIVALVLLGITIIKLFAYDIKNVSETGKIIAFILLGLLILIISFVYQKIKRLVIDDKNNETT